MRANFGWRRFFRSHTGQGHRRISSMSVLPNSASVAPWCSSAGLITRSWRSESTCRMISIAGSPNRSLAPLDRPAERARATS
jgi:hypothetical protein